MSRSTKKGPFIEPKLLKKVEIVRRSGERAVIKRGEMRIRWHGPSITIIPRMCNDPAPRYTSPA